MLVPLLLGPTAAFCAPTALSPGSGFTVRGTDVVVVWLQLLAPTLKALSLMK